MLNARLLRASSHARGVSKKPWTSSANPARLFSSRPNSRTSLFNSPTPRPTLQSFYRCHGVPSLVAFSRFNSTEGSVVVAAEKATGFIQAHKDLDEIVFSKTPDQLGYFSDLGLDFGWGTSSLAQWLIEHVHVYSGVPWWASIGLAALAVRVVTLPFTIKTTDTSARMAYMKPHIDALKQKRLEAVRDGDRARSVQASTEMQDLMRTAKINPLTSAYALIQLPIGFGFWRFIRNAADLPVPDFITGGAYWCMDLTAADPLFVLPMGLAAITHIFMRISFASSGNTLSPMMKNGMLYALPAVSFVFLCQAPSSLVLYFFCSTLWNSVVTSLFLLPSVRQLLGIAPIPPSVLLLAATPTTRLNLASPLLKPEIGTTLTEPTIDPNAGLVEKAQHSAKQVGAKVTDTYRKVMKPVLAKMDAENTLAPGQRRTPAQKRAVEKYEQKRSEELRKERAAAKQRRR